MEFALHILGQINMQIPTTALKLYFILFPCENINIIYNNQKFKWIKLISVLQNWGCSDDKLFC